VHHHSTLNKRRRATGLSRPSQQEAKDEQVITSFSGKCGKVGHKATDCRSKKKPARKPPAEESKTNFLVEIDSEEEDKFNFTVLSGRMNLMTDDSELLLDSGAHISVIKNCQLLTGLRKTSPVTRME
jgi:hypothetical protein